MDVSAEGFVVHKPAELLREEDAKFFAVVMGAIVFERLVVSLALLDIKPYAVIVAFAGDRRGIRFFFGRFFTGDDVRIEFGRNGRRGRDVLGLACTNDSCEVFASCVDVELGGVVVVNDFGLDESRFTHMNDN